MATKKVTETDPGIIIPSIDIARFQVRIVGTTPLITHRFGDIPKGQIQDAQSGKAKVKKGPRDPQAEFMDSCYRTPDGHFAFPASGIKKSMVTAAARYADDKKAVRLYGAFGITSELLEIEGDAPRMRTDNVVLSGIGHTAGIAYRPEFFPWAMTIPLTVNVGFVSIDQLVNLLRLAGFGVGIGDWRVEKKGTFGQFEVEGVNRLA